MGWLLLAQLPSPAVLATSADSDAPEPQAATLSVAVTEAGWPPFEYLDHAGRWSGLSADYLQRLAEGLGYGLLIRTYPDWEAVTRALLAGEADVAASFARTPERASRLAYTRAYIDNPVVLVTRRDAPELRNFSELPGRKLALERGHALVGLVRREYPRIRVREFPDSEAALRAVATGRADAYAGSLLVMAYVAELHGLANLQVRGPLPFATGALHFVAAAEREDLIRALDAELESLDPAEHAALRRTWVTDAVSARAGGRLVELDDTERAWLAARGPVRYAAPPDWPPFDLPGPDGGHRGISADFLRLIGERTGLEFEHVPTTDWAEALSLFRQGEVDLVTSVQRTQEREAFMAFTEPFLKVPLALVVRGGDPRPRSLPALAGQRVAVLRDSGMLQDLERAAPTAQPVPVASTSAALETLARGDADVVLDNLLVLAQPLRTRYAGDLEVATTLGGQGNDLRFGVRPDAPMLLDLLERGLAAVTAEEAASIQQRWQTFTIEEQVDWGRVLRIAGSLAAVFALVLAVVLWFNRRLRRAYDELRAAQAQLVESEKMAALGGLVAGVAHEINTPLGIAVTTSSQLRQEFEHLRERFEADSLTRSDLERHLQRALEGEGILLDNLQRAASLVGDFKQVAVDHQRDARRRFELDAYVREVLHGLSPRLRHAGIEVRTAIPEGIELDSYPGALARVLTNLLVNVEQHAYPASGGNVWLRAEPSADQVELVCEDQGVGMDAPTRHRVFEPFFTSRRHAGGVGLGMHIVWNLATQRLGGRITVDSAPGEGARFHLVIPLQAPQRDTGQPPSA